MCGLARLSDEGPGVTPDVMREANDIGTFNPTLQDQMRYSSEAGATPSAASSVTTRGNGLHEAPLRALGEDEWPRRQLNGGRSVSGSEPSRDRAKRSRDA